MAGGKFNFTTKVIHDPTILPLNGCITSMQFTIKAGTGADAFKVLQDTIKSIGLEGRVRITSLSGPMDPSIDQVFKEVV